MPTGHGSREPWTHREEEIVCRFYAKGVSEVAALLPGRTVEAIRLLAVKLGVAAATPRGLRQPCASEDRDAIIALHDQGMGYTAIAKTLGVDPQAVSNAVLMMQCERAGFTPAQRDSSGGLRAPEVERMYVMIREGFPNVEIQRRMAVSAACVSHYRRRLKKAGEQVTPPGQGLRYGGTRYPPDVRKQVELHFLQGYGAAKVAELARVSCTFAKKLRLKLIERLAAEGQSLPGCDITGRRVAVKESACFVTAQQKVDLQWLWLNGWAVAPAADHLGIGRSSAYTIVQKLKNELIREGRPFPERQSPAERPDLGHAPTRKTAPIALSPKPASHGAMPSLQRPVTILNTPAPSPLANISIPPANITAAQPRKRAPTLEEQLARIAAGARLVPTFKPSRPTIDATLGGVGSGML